MALPSSYTKDKIGELACTYAAFILHDEGIPITADKIKDLVNAANVEMEPFWPSVFAKFFQKKPVSDILANIGGSAASAGPAGAVESSATTAAAEEKKEEKKKESESEDDADAFGGLF
ncbi:hypothetical protein C9374_011443 [Naegleria lovaniensis]|uniref:60S acidic ribosomal protein P1 n=1 Tax=Naegleria lovaniensis TaxID=51637 RepID=A0AA88GX97_NAELO|nr:uncharacterized protein C9374_011443 [Naegleria lovaniensis]KAG2392718.1 hypothetical protein C9374_011443 [Naegleria lovaniensis]